MSRVIRNLVRRSGDLDYIQVTAWDHGDGRGCVKLRSVFVTQHGVHVISREVPFPLGRDPVASANRAIVDTVCEADAIYRSTPGAAHMAELAREIIDSAWANEEGL